MFVIFFAYFVTIFIVIKIIKAKRYRFKPFPKLAINRNGIYFNSKSIHRLKVGDVKLLELGTCVFIKKMNRVITIHNISNWHKEGEFLYFKAEGIVKICFDSNNIYRYFNIIIKSNKFNILTFQQLALKDVLNNIFSINRSVVLHKYLNFVNNVLNIEIDDEKLKVSKNKYNIGFELIYRINNKIKRVKVYETF